MKAKFSALLYRCFSVCLMLLVCCPTLSKDLGTYGATFEIQEPDLLRVIESKLTHLQKRGQLAALQKQWQQQAQDFLENPKPVKNIQHTKKPRTFYFDPSITLSENLTDHQGKLIHKAGTRVNPLKTHPLTRALLFLDGDDTEQLTWALQESKKRKATLILTNGRPIDLSQKNQQLFYFDQHGVLSQRLGIRQVPAIVAKDGFRLKIEEVVL